MNCENITLDVPAELISTTYNHIPSITSISYFHLLPNTKEDWITTILNSEGERVELESLKIKFKNARKGQEYLEYMQRAILLCTIEEKTIEGIWRFASNGIVIPNSIDNSPFSLSTHLIEDKKQLLVIIDKVGNTGSSCEDTQYLNIKFNFIATCEDDSGKKNPYLSQDPSVELGRPVGG